LPFARTFLFAPAIRRARQAILIYAGLAHPVTAANRLPADTIGRATVAILANLAAAIAAADTGAAILITGLAVTAEAIIGDVLTAVCRVAGVDGTGNAVIAGLGNPAASTTSAGIRGGTGIAIVTGSGVVGVGAPTYGITGVIGTDITVVTSDRCSCHASAASIAGLDSIAKQAVIAHLRITGEGSHITDMIGNDGQCWAIRIINTVPALHFMGRITYPGVSRRPIASIRRLRSSFTCPRPNIIPNGGTA